MTGKGPPVPDARRGSHGSNLDQSKRYDRILHDATHPERFSGQGGVLDFYGGDHKPLFPGVTMNKAQFSYELLDYLPLWLRVDTEIEGYGTEPKPAPAKPKRRRRVGI